MDVLAVRFRSGSPPYDTLHLLPLPLPLPLCTALGMEASDKAPTSSYMRSEGSDHTLEYILLSRALSTDWYGPFSTRYRPLFKRNPNTLQLDAINKLWQWRTLLATAEWMHVQCNGHFMSCGVARDQSAPRREGVERHGPKSLGFVVREQGSFPESVFTTPPDLRSRSKPSQDMDFSIISYDLFFPDWSVSRSGTPKKEKRGARLGYADQNCIVGLRKIYQGWEHRQTSFVRGPQGIWSVPFRVAINNRVDARSTHRQQFNHSLSLCLSLVQGTCEGEREK